MKKWIILALLPGAFFTAQLQAQTIRLDANMAVGNQFDAELEDRLGMESFLTSAMMGLTSANGGWSFSEGFSYGPVGLGYFHELDQGRLFLGASVSQYTYSADYASLSSYMWISAIGMNSVDTYEYSMLDFEVGYEFKQKNLIVMPKLGRRSYEKSFEQVTFSTVSAMGVSGTGITTKKLDGDSSGLYGALSLEYAVNDSIGLYFEGAKSFGAMTGTADMAIFDRSDAGIVTITDSRTVTMDQEVEFTTLKLGLRIKPAEQLSINVGLQQDTFSISYPGRFDVGATAVTNMGTTTSSTYSSATDVNSWMVTQALWGASQNDTRTGLYLGITKDIDL